MNKAILIAIPIMLLAAESLSAVETLPQKLPYQQQLRKFMATLKAEDFQPVVKDLKVMPFEGDADERFRIWILSLQPPAVGRKRNHSSVMIKSSHFTLDAIEGAKAIMRPPAHPEPLVDLAAWKYPGNPYFEARPLRLRAFVLASLDMIMVENLFDSKDDTAKPNQNQLVGAIGRFATCIRASATWCPARFATRTWRASRSSSDAPSIMVPLPSRQKPGHVYLGGAALSIGRS